MSTSIKFKRLSRSDFESSTRVFGAGELCFVYDNTSVDPVYDIYICKSGRIGYDAANFECYTRNRFDLLVETTYSNLVSLRDNSQLVPGTQYRITDYVTITKNDNTSIGEGKYKSIGHQFDIIVTASDINKLNENARAIQHSGDTYFSDQNLESWELKYSLDNDTNRFEWAKSDGKGVIYYMKDNLNNEKYYDFKNIQFVRKLDSEGNLDKVNGTLRWVYPIGIWKNGQSEDATLDANNDCHDTKEGYYFNSTSYKQYLNDGVTLGAKCYGWTCDNHCYGWTCGYNSRGWHVGTRCYNWTCGPWCSDWTCGEHCDGWTCGSGCSEWKVGNRCYNWTCGPESNYWSCGNRCFNWECGDHCSGWHVGNHCYYWKVGNSCFDWYCEGECHDWNLFVVGSTTVANSCKKFHIESGFHTNIYVPSDGSTYQNFYISRGVESNVTLSCPSGIEYKWIVTMDDNGSIKQYKESDTTVFKRGTGTNSIVADNGSSSTANGEGAYSEGDNTTASGDYSHASGLGTQASQTASFVCGKYNVPASAGAGVYADNYLFIVGDGTSSSNRRNSIAVIQDNNPSAGPAGVYINGIGGYNGASDFRMTLPKSLQECMRYVSPASYGIGATLSDEPYNTYQIHTCGVSDTNLALTVSASTSFSNPGYIHYMLIKTSASQGTTVSFSVTPSGKTVYKPSDTFKIEPNTAKEISWICPDANTMVITVSDTINQ